MNWTANDVITTDKYLSAFSNDYYKTDVFYLNRPFVWRGQVHTLPPMHKTLIVSGHSDYPMTNNIVSRYPFARWFCVNKQSSRVHGLPLGITNNTTESERHPIYGNVGVMVEVANTPRDIKNLAYMNFSVHTYPIERTAVWNMLCDKSWVTVEQPEDTLPGRKRFLENVRNHSFVICPRGHGIDTHRLWETLYMGSIPIVIRDIAHSDWTDLPILFIDSWEEVTEEMLQRELERIQNTTWNMEKLRIDYWIRLIRHQPN
jgi:hypothetical protein